MSVLPCKYSKVGEEMNHKFSMGVSWRGLRPGSNCDLRSPDGAGGRKGVTTEPEDNKEWEGCLFREENHRPV